YFYPGNSDHQWELGTGGSCGNAAPPQADWDEYTSGNVPGARRFVMSTGPFTLSPGAVHCISMAAVWARDTASTGAFPSVAALKAADDRIQMIFDSCFYQNVLGIEQAKNIQADNFPNPVNDFLEVQLKNNIAQAEFSIYDVTGRMVKHINLKQQQKFSVSCKD